MRLLYLLILIIVLFILYLVINYISFFKFIKTHETPPPKQTFYQLTSSAIKTKPINYVAMGDSLTSGTGTNDYTQTYPYIVGQNLLETTSEIDILNLGQPGGKITNYLINPEPLKKADLITVLLGINDVYDFTSYSQFEDHYKTLIRNVKANTDGKIVLLTIPYLGSDRIASILYRKIWDARTSHYNSIIKNIALENDLELVDLYALIGNSFEKDNSLYSADQFHPSSKGYVLWGNLINESRSIKP